jgi:hypothetical protein
MTAFELNDLMMSWYAMMGQDANMYLALVTGYLLVAYYMGANLSKLQCLVVSVFFTVWASSHVLALLSEMRAVMQIQDELISMNEFHFQTPVESLYISLIFAMIQIGGIFAALYFMWSVRHPATE